MRGACVTYYCVSRVIESASFWGTRSPIVVLRWLELLFFNDAENLRIDVDIYIYELIIQYSFRGHRVSGRGAKVSRQRARAGGREEG